MFQAQLGGNPELTNSDCRLRRVALLRQLSDVIALTDQSSTDLLRLWPCEFTLFNRLKQVCPSLPPCSPQQMELGVCSKQTLTITRPQMGCHRALQRDICRDSPPVFAPNHAQMPSTSLNLGRKDPGRSSIYPILRILKLVMLKPANVDVYLMVIGYGKYPA